MKISSLRLEVGPPRLGWAEMTVTFEDFRLSVLASNTPWDSIADLAAAAHGHVSRRSVEVVRWHIDPGAFLFRLVPNGERSVFEIFEFADSSMRWPPRPDPIFFVELGTKSLGGSILRCLRRLEGRVSADAYLQEWRHPFPTSAVKQLGDALKALK